MKARLVIKGVAKPHQPKHEMSKIKVSGWSELKADELIEFRDRLREARYAALADAEGFQQMCFAIEALGARVRGDSGALGNYRRFLSALVVQHTPIDFQEFDALYEALNMARNDVMHTGAYARHAAVSAVQLSMLIEEAILSEMKSKPQQSRKTVADFMVRTPVTAEEWHTVGHARRLMLLNSFSYLPMLYKGKWKLVSDMALAALLQPLAQGNRNLVAATALSDVLSCKKHPLKLSSAVVVLGTDDVESLLKSSKHPGLWLVVKTQEGEGAKHLIGVLSPFELM